jgi:hypothetical protein
MIEAIQKTAKAMISATPTIKAIGFQIWKIVLKTVFTILPKR